MTTTTSVRLAQRLIDAIAANDMEHLREMLVQEYDGRVRHYPTYQEGKVILQIALNAAAEKSNVGACRLLAHVLEEFRQAWAGVLYRYLHWVIKSDSLAICRTLVRQYQVDPFLQQLLQQQYAVVVVVVPDNENIVEPNSDQAASPFLAAARRPATRVLEFFLEVWDQRFASNGGKNHMGNYPIHVVCCDARVSLPAIQLLVHRPADAMAVVDRAHGLLPFQLAAMADADLQVIFYLLQHDPSAVIWSSRNAGYASSTPPPPPPPPSRWKKRWTRLLLRMLGHSRMKKTRHGYKVGLERFVVGKKPKAPPAAASK